MVESLVVSIVGFFILIASLLSQVELWQRKEYRLDRYIAYFRENSWLTGSSLLVPLALVTTGIASLATLINLENSVQTVSYLALLLFGAHHLYRNLSRGLFRPKPTQKALIVSTVAAAITLGLIYSAYLNNQQSVFLWAASVSLMPLFTGAAVLFANIAGSLKKHDTISEAKRLRKSLFHLTAVGITGSYGKTSTKYFLEQILNSAGSNFAVTKEHRNSVYPVAIDMLEQLNSDLAIYVAEMGAYASGEIEELAQLVQPSIGVITAISNQHVSLFGSLEKLAKTKWELAESLPKNGKLVLNADDKVIQKKAKSADQKIIWYSAETKTDVYFEDINISSRSLAATLHINEKQRQVSIPLAGKAALKNVVAAVATAHALDIETAAIFSSLSNLKPVSRTMEILPGINGSTIIDDSYSANEQGVLAAIEHLKLFPENIKIIILEPLIELGEKSSEVHERIGQALARLDAKIFISGNEYQDELGQKNQNIKFIASAKKLSKQVKAELEPGAIILVEGRIPESVRQGLY